MKLVFPKHDIDNAPKGYTRVRLTEEARGTKRLVRLPAASRSAQAGDAGVEWLEIGAGKPEEMTFRKFILLCRGIVQAAKAQKAKKIVVQFDRTPQLFKNIQDVTPERISQTAAEAFEMANFEFNHFKTKPKDGWNTVEEILLCGRTYKSIEDAVKRGQAVAAGVNACRVLANTPGGDMTPTLLAKAAKDAVKGLPVKVTTLGRKEMEKLGMGALLGVAKGSSEEPTFTIMEYKGGKGAPVVLAGKGITFDSGGLNIKPSNSMYEMHMDMSGAASVIHAVAIAAKLKLKQNVVGLLPSAENMLASNAMRPGDILKSMSGKTIEVIDTDAEGRLILADALTYAKKFNPSVVIDIATLTGAAHVALGNYASGLMTRDEKLSQVLIKNGEDSGDYVWPLPLWDEYEPVVKGTFADLANVSVGGGSRYGGATNGGMFLWQFAKELKVPWAHIDMAPRMTSASDEELAKGAAGAPVRLLVRFIEEWKP